MSTDYRRAPRAAVSAFLAETGSVLRTFLVVTSVAGLSACAPKPQRAQAPAPAAAPSATDLLSGELVVQLRSLGDVDAIRARFARVEVADAEGVVLRVRDPGFAGRETAVAEELARDSRVLLAEPNFRVTLRQGSAAPLPTAPAFPRDPRWLGLWGLTNYGQDIVGGTEGAPGADIGALEAWKTTTGSASVLVAIVDTGIDYTHPDLAPNIWTNQAELTGLPGVDDDGNGYADDVHGWDFVSDTRGAPYHGQVGDPDPMDDNGHGTHVAGTIGAAGNNGVGVVGVNWTVRMMGLKFLSGEGAGSSIDEYRALRYAIKMGVQVFNASYGGGGKSLLIESVLRELGTKGGLFVAAAGNDGGNIDESPTYPANYDLPNVLPVAATDNRDQLAGFSNYGYRTTALAAPGVAILSTYPKALAEKEGDGQPYRVFSGTSMATPHVVGAAALVLAANPGLAGNPAALKRRLVETVDWLPQLAGRVSSGGRLNVGRAVAGLAPGSAPPPSAWTWTEQAYTISTPSLPTERMNAVYRVHIPGAKGLRLHIDRAQIDTAYDTAILFDGRFRPVLELPELMVDQWLPLVLGDTAYIQFSNAQVAIQKFLGEQETDDPEKFGDRAPICFQEGTKWKCQVYSEPGDPFANFNSEGFHVDRIQVAK